MILKEISDLVCIDETTLLNNNENFTHFLSFPSNLIVPESFKSYFYASEQIANYICKCKDLAVPSKFVKPLNLNETQSIKLSNSEKIEVTLFSDEKITGCLCYHFKNKNNITALYLGHFRNISALENNKLFMDLISNGINYAYLDNTRIGSSYYTLHTVVDVLREIQGIFLKYPNYKMCMGLPIFGYQELVVNLLKFYKISINRKIQKIYKSYDPKIKFYDKRNADIILCDDSATVEQLKERFTQKKVVTIRLLEKCKHKLEKFNSVLGIKMLFCSPHMKTCELRAIVELTQPVHIKDIYSNEDKIPNFYKQASLNWVKEYNDYEDVNSTPLYCDFSAADTEVFEPVQQRKKPKSRRSSEDVNIQLEREIEKLRNTNPSDFNGRTAISTIFDKDYMLPKRKKSRKQISLRPKMELIHDDIKLEESTQNAESNFDLHLVNSFSELYSFPSIHPSNSPNQRELSPKKIGLPEDEPSPVIKDCSAKQKISELIEKTYQLQLAKKREIENNKKNQKFIESDNRNGISDEPLDLNLVNNTELDTDSIEIRVDENLKSTDPKKFGPAKSKEIKKKAAPVYVVDYSQPLNLELLNDVELGSDWVGSGDDDSVQTVQNENLKTKLTGKRTQYGTRKQVLANNNEVNQNVRKNDYKIDYNNPLDLDLLNDVELDSGWFETVDRGGEESSLNFEFFGYVDDELVTKTCSVTEGPSVAINISDDEKSEQPVQNKNKKIHHVVDLLRRKRRLTSPKDINYLDE